jgi:hypothetical protein
MSSCLSPQAGKGDKPRPYDVNKYAYNHSLIKWRNSKKPPKWKSKIRTKPIKKCEEK